MGNQNIISTMASTELSEPGAWRRGIPISIALIIFSAWLANNPYLGLTHDTKLYAAQALYHLYPAAFNKDLFFQFGSQDDFTIFSNIQALGIRALGLQNANLLIIVLSKLLCFGGAYFFLRSEFGDTATYISLLLITAFSPTYGGLGSVYYGESLVTSRPYAEAIVLLALGLFFKKRFVSSICLMTVAMLLHALMALPGILLMLTLWFLRSEHKFRRMALASAGCLFFLALAITGVPLIGRLLTSYDNEWLRLVKAGNPFLFPETWWALDWSRTLLIIILLICAQILQTGRPKLLACATLVTAIASLVIWCLGVGLYRSVLLTQLQPWRALWLAQIVALASFGNLCTIIYNGQDKERLLLTLLAIAIAFDHVISGPLSALGLVTYLFLSRLNPGWKATIATRWLLAILFILAFAYRIVVSWLMLRASGIQHLSTTIILFNPITTAFIVMITVLIYKRARTVLIVMLPLLLAIPTAAAGSFLFVQDRAPAGWISDPNVIRDIRNVIPPQAVVYWPNHLSTVWFELHRAYYASRRQMAGIVFSRSTAIEGRRRQKILQSAGLMDGILRWLSVRDAEALSRTMHQATDGQVIALLCSDPVLSYIIFNTPPTNDSPVALRAVLQRDHLRVYDCQQHRSQASELSGATRTIGFTQR